MVIEDLIAADAADSEVLRLRMREIQAAHSRRRQHGEILGQLDSGPLSAQQREERRFLAVIGRGRISGCRTDAPVLLRDHFIARQVLVRRVPLRARLFVEQLRERLGQAIGQRFRHDGVVVIVVALKARHHLGNSDAGRDREPADVVDDVALLRGHEVRQSQIPARVRLLLLPQCVKARDDLAARLIGVDLDVVSHRVGRPETVDSARMKETVFDDLAKELPPVVVKLFRARLVEDLGVLSAQLPGGEERIPVDEGLDALERHIVEHVNAEKGRALGRKRQRRPAAARGLNRQQLHLALPFGLRFAEMLVLALTLAHEIVAPVGQQRADDTDGARGIEHVHGRVRVAGRDFHGRMQLRSRRAADQHRQHEFAPLHLPRHVHHLIERRRDESGEADDVDLLGDGRIEDPVRRNHHAQVDHLVVVAAENHADDVLSDVVYIALDRGHQNLAAFGEIAGLRFLRLHERQQIGNGLFHHPRAFHDLREKHLAGPEEIADDVHAVHQRSFDDRESARICLPRLLQIVVEILDDPFDERM